MPKGYKQKEITLVKAFVKWLTSLEECHAYKRAAGRDRKGKPDVTGCIQGIRIEVEVKIGENTPTSIQLLHLRKWKEAGAITGWSNNLQGLKAIILDGALKRNIVLKFKPKIKK